MVRSSLKPVLSLCLIVVAGYGAYIPLEKVRSHQIESAAKPMAVNALVSDMKSRTDASSPDAATTARLVIEGGLVIEGERAVDHANPYHTDLNDKAL